MEYDYQRAVLFPSSVTIGGVTLQAPTLAQWRILETLRSPFAVGGSADMPAVRTALLVLSTPAETLDLGSRKQSRIRNLRTVVSELREFISYVWQTPEVYVRDGEKKGTGFELCTCSASRLAMRAIECHAVEFNHRRVTSVWDITIPEALYAITVWNELHGTEYESNG